MTKEENLKELIFSQFDKEIEGSDIYEHTGSKWIIFTDSRKWVVEFTKDKTLWFNYHHFNSILVLFAMDSSSNKDIIKEWYENRFIFKPEIKKVYAEFRSYGKKWIDNVVENGVVATRLGNFGKLPLVKRVIQNGVKNIYCDSNETLTSIEDTIQNEVNHMISGEFISEDIIEDTIQNGVKHIRTSGENTVVGVDDIIQNGVKHIQAFHSDLYPLVEGAITKGVKC